MWRAHKAVLERISEAIRRLREEVGQEPRPLHSRPIIERTSTQPPRFQLYLPGLGVSGEGRCICEASLETAYAFEALLDAALEHKDWNVLPLPDRSLRAWLAAMKTELYFKLQSFLDERIPSEDAAEYRSISSGFSAALT